MIYFVTVNYYSALLINQLINSLLPTNPDFEYKFIIVNNSPQDAPIYNLASENVLIIDAQRNIGFGGACNLGIQWVYHQDSKAIIWIVNPDAYFVGNSYQSIKSFFHTYPEISILGTIIRTPTNRIWFAGGRFISQTGSIFSDDLLTNRDADYVECDWVSGCSLIINCRNFTDAPFFDTCYFLYYEDFDFCRRYAIEGHKIAVTKLFSIIHQPSSITNRYIGKKVLHSTHSYLLTLERYSNKFIFLIRLIRLLALALILIFIKPQVAFGKIQAVFLYCKGVGSRE